MRQVLKDLGPFRVREVFLDPRRENLASSRYNALFFHSPSCILEKAILRIRRHCERVLLLRRNPIVYMNRFLNEECFGSYLCCTASQCQCLTRRIPDISGLTSSVSAKPQPESL